MIEGTDEDDFIDGRRGNDLISDGLGSDEILGGRGDDSIELEGTGEDSSDTSGRDEADGQRGDDNIVINADTGFIVVHGGSDDDFIRGSQGNGEIDGDSGNDEIITHEAVFDVWGGFGDDVIDGQSECLIPKAYGESGNDRIIFAGDFASGGPGNDFIQFFDCVGVAYGDSGNDELRATPEHPNELHGGSGNDELIGESNIDQLFGDNGRDTLTGDEGADSFSCGPGIDTITDFNAAEGDTKTADCENF
jgi:Ca2+-binding RTX toxin-like protein